MPGTIEFLTFTATASTALADTALILAVPALVAMIALLATNRADLLLLPLGVVIVSMLMAAVGIAAGHWYPLAIIAAGTGVAIFAGQFLAAARSALTERRAG
ncbi:hypothetical protein [Microbacterium aquimaris]|uniref:Uncharacterized protein n=1 Tax=Microbacterium aquimaris TaxID=459816 RepID=A0ABU5N5D4_9MICO|nr:hypothetical protein [Microbacterium aquimaris]MAP63974.1 hypothetical protein [Microbacterium sp.]MDZ8161296.1 hypothetical protein [Microbacterium aquimaris]MDZ8274775.1 hypothetical protein [Microbacterium aquimaris]|tara:strand:- start:1091 stop:1396 length:306 start_codon:yes stop_codon:yes gene_type:complete